MALTPCVFPETTVNTNQQEFTILTVCSKEADHIVVDRLCRQRGWKAAHARTCSEAIDEVNWAMPVVVITENDIPDGGWQEILAALNELPHRPLMIVAARFAEMRLWGEVINFGGYDLLQLPFEPRELERVLESAIHTWVELSVHPVR